MLRTDDGQLIYAHYPGLSWNSAACKHPDLITVIYRTTTVSKTSTARKLSAAEPLSR